jgi:hypothetical protein
LDCRCQSTNGCRPLSHTQPGVPLQPVRRHEVHRQLNGARSLEWHIRRAEVVHKKPQKQQDLRPDPRFAELSDLELWELMNVQRPRPDHLGGAVKRELDRRAREAEHKAQTDPRGTRSRVRERPHDGRSGGPPGPATEVREPRRPRPSSGSGSAQLPADQ